MMVRPVVVRIIIDTGADPTTEILFERCERLVIDSSGVIVDGKYRFVRPLREEIMSTPKQVFDQDGGPKPLRGDTEVYYYKNDKDWSDRG